MKGTPILAAFLLAACGSHATPAKQATSKPAAALPTRHAAGAATLLPGDTPDGPSRSLPDADLHVIPFRIVANDGLSDARCGVLIDGQRVMTLGAGDLDAYTCLKLVEAHDLTARRAGRLGLLYEAASRNASMRTAVLLVRDRQGHWRVDAGATSLFDDLAEKSWPAFLKALDRRSAR